jgi:quercetin dioxygenase-like cupin family protein
MKSDNFLPECQLPWEELGGGVSRQIVGYDEDLMLVKVKFIKGAVGSVHKHFHSQTSLVSSGTFEVSIKGEKRILHTGDGFYVEPNVLHGVVCLREGMLIDTFNPARKDFLKNV